MEPTKQRYNSQFFSLLPAEIFSYLLVILGPFGKALLASSNKEYFKMCYFIKMTLNKPSPAFIDLIGNIFDTGLNSLQINDTSLLDSRDLKYLFTSPTLRIKELTFGKKKVCLMKDYYGFKSKMNNCVINQNVLNKLTIWGDSYDVFSEQFYKMLSNLNEYISNEYFIGCDCLTISQFLKLVSSRDNMECFEFRASVFHMCHHIVFDSLKELEKLKKVNFRIDCYVNSDFYLLTIPHFIHRSDSWKSVLTHLKLSVYAHNNNITSVVDKFAFINECDLQNLSDANPFLEYLDLASCNFLGVTFQQIVHVMDSKFDNIKRLILPMYLYDAGVVESIRQILFDIKNTRSTISKTKREIIVDFYDDKNAKARAFFDDWIAPDKTVRMFLEVH